MQAEWPLLRMTTIELLQRLALALAIGLLVGVERGWRGRDVKDGARAAGTRTYALIGLLGGVAAALVPFAGEILLAGVLVAFVFSFAFFEMREARMANTASATGLVAAILTFALGAYAVLGDAVVAGAAGIAATIVLAERQFIHSFVARLTWGELRAALLLLAMTFVLLPVLPDRTIDPWQALNPRQLWLMMVIIAAVSYVGYICVRLLGDRAGLVLAAAAGGLVSSTAVTLAYARLSKLEPKSSGALASGITASWAVSLSRMSAIAIAIAPTLAGPLARIIVPSVLILAGITAVFYRRSSATHGAPPLALSDPFELGEILKFGLLLAIVSLASKMFSGVGGHFGLVPLAAISGFVDVDPITLSVARLAGTSIATVDAANTILVAAASNLACKLSVVVVLGSRALLTEIALAAAAVATTAVTAYFVFA